MLMQQGELDANTQKLWLMLDVYISCVHSDENVTSPSGMVRTCTPYKPNHGKYILPDPAKAELNSTIITYLHRVFETTSCINQMSLEAQILKAVKSGFIQKLSFSKDHICRIQDCHVLSTALLGDNTFGSVCPSVRPSATTLTAELFDRYFLWPWGTFKMIAR